MTISSTNRKAGPYAGTGTVATYPFAFKVFQASDLIVTRTDLTPADTELALTTDYTVSLNADQNGSPGGDVILNADLPTGYLLTITSGVPELQPTALTNNGGFFPKTINDSLDRLTILAQQESEKQARSLVAPVSDPATDFTLLPASLRANKVFLWGPSGEALAVAGNFFKGDPGGNTMAIGLFSQAALLNIPVGVDAVWTSGHHATGSGAARYTFDSTRTGGAATAYVALWPRSSFVTANGRLFVLDAPLALLSQFGAPLSSTATDAAPHLLEFLNYISARRCGGFADVDCSILSNVTPTDLTLNVATFHGCPLRIPSTVSLVLSRCTGDVNLQVIGDLSSTQQYQSFATGVAAYFTAGVTYEKVDNANVVTTIDGSDFKHVLTGNLMDTGMLTALGAPVASGDKQYRRIISGPIALDPTKRYVCDVVGLAIQGNGLAPISFRLYDAGDNFLGTYIPSDTGENNWYPAGTGYNPDKSLITGVSKMRVVLEAQRSYRTADAQEGTYDLSKVIILQLVNDMATAPIYPFALASPVQLSNCTDLVIGGNYSLIAGNAIQAYGLSTRVTARRATVTYCYQGFDFTNTIDSTIEFCSVDCGFLDDAGNPQTMRPYRTRGVAGTASQNITVERCSFTNVAWGIELIGNATRRGATVSRTNINATYCGISMPGGGLIEDVSLLIGGTGVFGIEVPISSGIGWVGKIKGATIAYGAYNSFGIGIAGTTISEVIMTGGSISAPVGVWFPGGGQRAVLTPDFMQCCNLFCYSEIAELELNCRDTRKYSGMRTYPYEDQAIVANPGGVPRSVRITGDFPIGADGGVSISGATTYELIDLVLRGDGLARYCEIEILPGGQVVAGRHERVSLRNVNTTINGLVALTGAFDPACSWYVNGNSVNNVANNGFSGSGAPNYSNVTGDDHMRGTLASLAPGAVTPTAPVTLGTVTIPGARIGDAARACPYAPAGMPAGTFVTATVTANDTVTLVLMTTLTTVTPAASAWEVYVTKV